MQHYKMPCACIYNDRKNWGNQLWAILHYLPIRLNSLQKVSQMLDFIRNVYLALPCEECHKHCKEYMKQNSIALTNPNDLNVCKSDISKFIFDFHNHVNLITKKELFMNFESYQKIQPIQPDLNEVRKVFDNIINRNFFNSFLTPTERQYGNSFINTYISFG